MRSLLRFALIMTVMSCASGCGTLVGLVRYGLPQSSLGDLRQGSPAPDLELATLAGETVRLHDLFDGRPTVLVFGSFT